MLFVGLLADGSWAALAGDNVGWLARIELHTQLKLDTYCAEHWFLVLGSIGTLIAIACVR